MKLSVVIVNYNVEHFLEQCLQSVREAGKGVDMEVFVVDNNSVDGSVEMVRSKFPEAILIANKDNVGFSRANNQAIKMAKGEYVLLLNPDTVVENDTFQKVIKFMDEHPNAGGLGVNMVDGKGNFLPESKRGLPTPSVAFYKIFGLAKLFPKSKRFGKYHLGYLDKNETHEVDVLSGAFMLLRKEALDKTGLLDEDFFMYGEDIDLSYRIIQAGYKNYYYPEARIIHYKGESTKKNSINYIFVFYRAMVIFAQKHFSQKNAKLFSFFINSAIWFRASLSLLKRFIKSIWLPLLDAITVYMEIYFIGLYWENIILGSGQGYPDLYMWAVIPIYILIWLVAIWLSGGYDKPVRLRNIYQGILFGTIAILVLFALLPGALRFSRAMIFWGTACMLLDLTIIRIALHLLKVPDYTLNKSINRRIVIVGNEAETKRVSDLLKRTNLNPDFLGIVGYDDDKKIDNPNFLGTFRQLKEILAIYKINEIIFSTGDISSKKIIDYMIDLQDYNVDYKIAPPESLSIIGSNSIHTSGDLYTIDVSTISKPEYRRKKAILDILSALTFIIIFPVNYFIVKHPGQYLKNCFLVLFRKKSWVGFSSHENSQHRLPKIKPGILTPVDAFPKENVSQEARERLDVLYAKDYSVYQDISIIFKGYRNLGRKVDKNVNK
ncbi:MAG: glycosyltransferase family 2 protein [Bacteroidales bacterium]|jgi:GT2 family glycosyltransferase|nr:glycosyltransferase family 2 protein [Bacteroidales bacterium]